MAKSYDEIIQVIQHKKLFVPGLNHYFDVILKSNIPFNDVKFNINDIYNVSNVEELRWLMESMYSLRHPLLNEYLITYNLTVEDKIKAVALLFDKNMRSLNNTGVKFLLIKKMHWTWFFLQLSFRTKDCIILLK